MLLENTVGCFVLRKCWSAVSGISIFHVVVWKHVGAQYRRITVKRMLHDWLPIEMHMEVKHEG